MTQKLESIQESVLEELMQMSFGAQNLYIPRNYKKGIKKNREKEPCDLIWYGNDVLVLFYLTSGNKTIEKQDEHNLKQANKWINYWKRQPKECLIAKNRYDDETSILFKDIQYCVCISVISHTTGIVFHKVNENKPIGYTCTVPEALIHSISGFHGTVIDLLAIIQKYSMNLWRHIVKHGPICGERLAVIVDKKIEEIDSIFNLQADTKVNSDNFSFIYKFIDEYRLSDPFGNGLSNSSGRQTVADYYCDMSARDYILLAITAEKVIERADNGRFSLAAETRGMYLDWVVCVTNISARNMMDFFDPLINAVKEKNLPVLIYAYFFEGAEHRSPSMHIFPERKSTQAQHLVELVVQRLSAVLKK